MRKFAMILVVFAAVVGLSGCTVRGDGTELYDDVKPYAVEAYMQVPAEWISADNWAQFETKVKNEIEIQNSTRDGVWTNLTVSVDLDTPYRDGDTVIFIITIKGDSVKQKSSTIKSDLWYRYQTVHMFNPLNILKPVDGVIYYFGAAWENRITNVPNAVASRTEDGLYQYVWYSNTSATPVWDWENTDLVLNNKYANSPIWYGLAIAIGAVVGVIVYFACRKKAQK